MFLVWIGVALLIARWFELGPLAEVSWWWILSPLAVAFIWFEVIESRFGFDKHKQHEDADRARRERVAAQFKAPGRRPEKFDASYFQAGISGLGSALPRQLCHSLIH